MTNECSVCKNSFSTKSALVKHRKTAKYCIQPKEVDEETDIDISVPKLLKCRYCQYKSKVKANLLRHEEKCKCKTGEEESVKEELINQMEIKLREQESRLLAQDDEILELGRLLDEVKRSKEIELARLEGALGIGLPKGIIGKQKRSPKLQSVEPPPVPFTRKLIDDNLHLFTFEIFMKFEKGIADFIKTITDDCKSYYCSDKSRRGFKRFDENCKWVADPKGMFVEEVFASLRENIFPSIDEYYKRVLNIDNYSDKDDVPAFHQRADAICAAQPFMKVMDFPKEDEKFRNKVLDCLKVREEIVC